MKGQTEKLLRSEVSSCIFCRRETSHDVIRITTKPPVLRSTPTSERVIELCKDCGSYRIASSDAVGVSPEPVVFLPSIAASAQPAEELIPLVDADLAPVPWEVTPPDQVLTQSDESTADRLVPGAVVDPIQAPNLGAGRFSAVIGAVVIVAAVRRRRRSRRIQVS